MIEQTAGNNLIDSMLQVGVALSTIASLVVATVGLWYSFKINQAFRRQEQVNNIPRLYFEEYSNAKLTGNIKLIQNGDRIIISTLKEARAWARQEVKEAAGRERFLKRSRDEGSTENQIAYEFSLALERIGASAFVGAIPLDFVLATGATMIMEDWGYCHRLVQRMRSDYGCEGESTSHPERRVGFHRRHGEWLAYIAAIWLHQKNWSNKDLHRFLDEVASEVAAEIRDKKRKQIGLIRSQVTKIEQEDDDILSDVTLRYRKRIISSDDGW